MASVWISGAIHTLWVLRGRGRYQSQGVGWDGGRVPVENAHFIVAAVRANVFQYNSRFTVMAGEQRLLHWLTVILMG